MGRKKVERTPEQIEADKERMAKLRQQRAEKKAAAIASGEQQKKQRKQKPSVKLEILLSPQQFKALSQQYRGAKSIGIKPVADSEQP